MLRGLRGLLSSFLAVSLAFLSIQYSFAEEKQEVKQTEEKRTSLIEKVLGVKEANAMPVVPVPEQIIIPQLIVPQSFITYINQPHIEYDKKALKKEWEEKLGVANPFRYYYWARGQKDRFEEKYLTVNFDKSKGKDKNEERKETNRKKGVSKIKLGGDEEGPEIIVSFREYKNKKKSFKVKYDRDGMIKAMYTFNF